MTEGTKRGLPGISRKPCELRGNGTKTGQIYGSGKTAHFKDQSGWIDKNMFVAAAYAYGGLFPGYLGSAGSAQKRILRKSGFCLIRCFRIRD
jgi:hypothetical protein